MNILFVILLPLLSTLALATEPKVLSGSFALGPAWEQLIAYRVEVARDQVQVRNLRENGYVCNFTGANLYRCRKFIADLPAQQEVDRKFEGLEGLTVSFGEARSIEQIYQSELFAEYAVSQKVEARETYEEHRYLMSVSQGQMVEKVQFFRGEELREEFLVEDPQTLGLVVTLQRTLGPRTHEVRLLRFRLRKQ